MHRRDKKKDQEGENEAMKFDIILSGVGGQGVLSVAAIIAAGAMKDGFRVRQSEVHGMAQRGGAVISHMRISERGISSDLVARGTASLILSMEPLEALRYVDYLSGEGHIITASEPVLNIPDYPDLDEVREKIRKYPRQSIVNSLALAKEAGSSLAVNMVMVGAASSLIPVKKESLKAAVVELFSAKGKNVVDINLKAFDLGSRSIGK